MNNEIAYNLSPGGDGCVAYESQLKGAATRKALGLKRTPESKAKLSAALKGKCKSNIHKKHLSEHHRLRTLHIIFYDESHYEFTYDCITKIANDHNIPEGSLRKTSLRGDNRFGFYLLDITDFSHAFDMQCVKSRDKCFYDPILKDKINYYTLRSRHQHNPELYEDMPYYTYDEDMYKQKLEYIETQEVLRTKLLKEYEKG